jgi:hypothetical protein
VEVLDDFAERIWPNQSRLLEIMGDADFYLRSLANFVGAVAPIVGSTILIKLLCRLAELRTQGEPSQEQYYLCPVFCPIPKLGPSARGPPSASPVSSLYSPGAVESAPQVKHLSHSVLITSPLQFFSVHALR